MSLVPPITDEPDWAWDPDKPLHIVTITPEEAAYATGIPKGLPLPAGFPRFPSWLDGGRCALLYPPKEDGADIATVLVVASLLATMPKPRPEGLLATVGWSGWEKYIRGLDDCFSAGMSKLRHFQQEYLAAPPRVGDYVTMRDATDPMSGGTFQVVAIEPPNVRLTPGGKSVSMGCVASAYWPPTPINFTAAIDIIDPDPPEPPKKPLEGWDGWPLGPPEYE